LFLPCFEQNDSRAQGAIGEPQVFFWESKQSGVESIFNPSWPRAFSESATEFGQNKTSREKISTALWHHPNILGPAKGRHPLKVLKNFRYPIRSLGRFEKGSQMKASRFRSLRALQLLSLSSLLSASTLAIASEKIAGEIEFATRQELVSTAIAQLKSQPDLSRVQAQLISNKTFEIALQAGSLKARLLVPENTTIQLNEHPLELQRHKDLEAQRQYVIRILRMKKVSLRFDLSWLISEARAQNSDDEIAIANYVLAFDQKIRSFGYGWYPGRLRERRPDDISIRQWESFRGLVPKEHQNKSLRGIRLYCNTDFRNTGSDSASFRRQRQNLCIGTTVPSHRVVIFLDDGTVIDQRTVPVSQNGRCDFSKSEMKNLEYRHFVAEEAVQSSGHRRAVRDDTLIVSDSRLKQCCETEPNCVDRAQQYFQNSENVPAAAKRGAQPSGRDRGFESVR